MYKSLYGKEECDNVLNNCNMTHKILRNDPCFVCGIGYIICYLYFIDPFI